MNYFNILLTFFLLNTYNVCGYWGWKCIQGVCSKSSPHPDLEYNEKELTPFQNYYNPLQVCSVVCNTYSTLWPLPSGNYTIGKKLRRLTPMNIFFDDHIKNEVFDDMKQIFTDNVKAMCKSPCVDVSLNYVTIKTEVLSKHVNLAQDTIENYTLKITSDSSYETIVYIKANNIFGARNGLETLRQLIASHSVYDYGNLDYNEIAIVASAYITDYPIFKYRGLLIDTSRNYITIPVLKKQLNGMAASKLNVFHWHITDTQSFPLLIPGLENFTLYGAYSDRSVYKIEDVIMLKKYAEARGIRMIVEIDMPSHAGNGWQWGEKSGLGELAVCVNAEPWKKYCIQPPCGQLNPANPNVYKMIRKLFEALIVILNPDEFFHIGGDEVFKKCWEAQDEIMDYMEEMQFDNVEQLWVWFEEKVIKIIDKITNELGFPKKKIILYSSQLTSPKKISNYFPDKNRIIVQTWVPNTSDLDKKLINLGYNIIISTKNTWYLDHGLGHGGDSYHTWQKAYANQIPVHENVLGGEACLWSELVYDNTIDARIWPRAAVVAERLWSNPQNLKMETVKERLHEHRSRLIQTGLGPEAISPFWCAQNRHIC